MKLDLNKIEVKLDAELKNETSESLTNWLKEKRDKQQSSLEFLVENAEYFFGHHLDGAIIEQSNMAQLFATEHDAIKWVASNISLAIKPKNKAKTMFVYPFSSVNAHMVIVESLGKQLFKHQQKLIK